MTALSIQIFISQSSSFIWICSFGIVPTVQLYQTESVPPLSVELSIKASVSSSSLVHAANRCIHRVNGAMVATERRLGRGNRTQRGRNKCRKIFLLYACPRTHKMFTVSHSTLGWSLVTGDWNVVSHRWFAVCTLQRCTEHSDIALFHRRVNISQLY